MQGQDEAEGRDGVERRPDVAIVIVVVGAVWHRISEMAVLPALMLAPALMGEAVVLLRHPYENRRVGRLMNLWTEYLHGKIAVHTVRGAGETRCAALLDLIMIGDFTALHIAAARGIDPNDVPYISQTVKYGVAAPQRIHAGDD